MTCFLQEFFANSKSVSKEKKEKKYCVCVLFKEHWVKIMLTLMSKLLEINDQGKREKNLKRKEISNY
jgi:hypothetical protein